MYYHSYSRSYVSGIHLSVSMSRYRIIDYLHIIWRKFSTFRILERHCYASWPEPQKWLLCYDFTCLRVGLEIICTSRACAPAFLDMGCRCNFTSPRAYATYIQLGCPPFMSFAATYCLGIPDVGVVFGRHDITIHNRQNWARNSYINDIHVWPSSTNLISPPRFYHANKCIHTSIRTRY